MSSDADLEQAARELNRQADENVAAAEARRSGLKALAHLRRVAGKLLTAVEEAAIKAAEVAISNALAGK